MSLRDASKPAVIVAICVVLPLAVDVSALSDASLAANIAALAAMFEIFV